MRSSDYYLHGVLLGSLLCGRKGTVGRIDEVMRGVAREMGMNAFKQSQLPNLETNLLHMDEVCASSDDERTNAAGVSDS